jgi:hypothetical protein
MEILEFQHNIHLVVVYYNDGKSNLCVQASASLRTSISANYTVPN